MISLPGGEILNSPGEVFQFLESGKSPPRLAGVLHEPAQRIHHPHLLNRAAADLEQLRARDEHCWREPTVEVVGALHLSVWRPSE
jgi:hypothetical protein